MDLFARVAGIAKILLALFKVRVIGVKSYILSFVSFSIKTQNSRLDPRI